MQQTIEQIKEILAAKNIRFSESSNKFSDYLLGIELSRHCYTWFEFIEFKGSHFLVFDHTYSMNTGETKKGYSHRVIKYAQLEKLGINNLFTRS